MLQITVNNTNLNVELQDNSSARALRDYLRERGSITLEMKEYAHMEKFGDLHKTLPTNDRRITTKPGDIILYLGNYLVIYYDSNSWNLTKLGKVTNLNDVELRKVLGKGDIKATLSLIEDKE